MFLCIDMKCFFASVECAERGLDPMTTPLVVADKSRGKGALCLAVSPFLKQQGVSSRGRLFNIPKTISYISAKPRMKLYMEYAIQIHRIFLRYVDGIDIHTYSIDEAFLNISPYLAIYQTPSQLALKIMEDIKKELGIIATCGAGDNLYLAKLSLDLLAKKEFPYYHYLSLEEFYSKIWFHPNLKDIWQIGSGLSKRLNKLGISNLHDLAMRSKEELQKEFGVIGLDLYEHAWGIDQTTIADIKAYEPKSKSFSRHQILFRDYAKEEAWTPLVEMVFLLCIELSFKKLLTNHIFFYIGYSKHSNFYHKAISLDAYIDDFFLIKKELEKEFERVPKGDIRSIGISFSNFIEREQGGNTLFYIPNPKYDQLSKAIYEVWEKYGKNALVIGTAARQESTLYQRNKQIGGHNSE